MNPPDDSSPELPTGPELEARVDAAIELLTGLRDDPSRLADLDPERRRRLRIAAGQLARPSPWAKRELARTVGRREKLRARNEQRAADAPLLAKCGIRAKRRELVFSTPLLAAASVIPEAGPRRVGEARNCYICKTDFHQLHFYYDALCPACAELNWAKRQQTADLRGRVALLTGARVKIGYQAAILLLRAGARVIVTSRFPVDAARRYACEPDAADWGHRLEIHGLDLRHTPSVERFAQHLLSSHTRLDFILNNACQTVRRPTGFYAHLVAAERAPGELPELARRALHVYQERRAGPALALRDRQAQPLADSVELAQIAVHDEDRLGGAGLFPEGRLDADLQQVDLRGRNSWRLALDEVSAVELLEVQLVNCVAPFLLNARLKPLLLRAPGRDQHIVNVSAVEGQFYRSFKTDKHPHTNMAKAALNMMTRTAAADYVRDGIHMNSVDTGWVTDEDPAEIAARKTAEMGFHPPLDIVDGAARICDPIFSGLNSGNHLWGQFLKDYMPTRW